MWVSSGGDSPSLVGWPLALTGELKPREAGLSPKAAQQGWSRAGLSILPVALYPMSGTWGCIEISTNADHPLTWRPRPRAPSPGRLCGRDWLLSQLPRRPDCCCPLLQIPPQGWGAGWGGGLGNEQKELVRKGEADRQLNRASQLTWVSPLRPVERGSTWPPGWPQATQQAGP